MSGYPNVDGFAWNRMNPVTSGGGPPTTSAPSSSGGPSHSGGPRSSMGSYDAYTGTGSGGGMISTAGGPPARGAHYVPDFGH